MEEAQQSPVISQVLPVSRLQTQDCHPTSLPLTVRWKDPPTSRKLHAAGWVYCGQGVTLSQRSKAQPLNVGNGDRDRVGQGSKRPQSCGKKKSDREACFLPVSSPGASSAGSSSGAKGVGISWGHFRPPRAPRKSAAFSIRNPHARPWAGQRASPLSRGWQPPNPDFPGPV